MKNNISVFIFVFLIVVLGNSVYEQINKEPISAKAKRLSCQKQVTSFERAFGDEDIKVSQLQLESGNYNFTSHIEKSEYMESKLFNYVTLSNLDIVTNNELKSYIQKNKLNDEKLKITYYIYENDKKHPGKKTEKSKNYAGYVVFKFYNTKNKLVFQSQIDFMDMQGTDIPKSIRCAVKSFSTYNKEGKI